MFYNKSVCFFLVSVALQQKFKQPIQVIHIHHGTVPTRRPRYTDSHNNPSFLWNIDWLFTMTVAHYNEHCKEHCSEHVVPRSLAFTSLMLPFRRWDRAKFWDLYGGGARYKTTRPLLASRSFLAIFSLMSFKVAYLKTLWWLLCWFCKLSECIDNVAISWINYADSLLQSFASSVSFCLWIYLDWNVLLLFRFTNRIKG